MSSVIVISKVLFRSLPAVIVAVRFATVPIAAAEVPDVSVPVETVPIAVYHTHETAAENAPALSANCPICGAILIVIIAFARKQLIKYCKENTHRCFLGLSIVANWLADGLSWVIQNGTAYVVDQFGRAIDALKWMKETLAKMSWSDIKALIRYLGCTLVIGPSGLCSSEHF